MTDTMSRPATRRPLTQGEIEDLIVTLTEKLEKETERYAEVCDEVAVREADWKFGYHTALVELADSGQKLSIPLREAKANLAAGKDTFLVHRLAQERQKAQASLLRSIGQRLDGYRTLAANVRGQT